MKGLGRGFDSLIPTDLIDDEFDLTAVEDKKESKLKELKLDDIVRDEEQPRREFDEGALEALAASIKEHGVLQPIVVTKEEEKYKIVAGERRWRASKIAGLTKIPAIIRTLDSQNRLELSIIENAQREDLNAIELATAYAKLKNQFNLTPEDIAAKVGKSESSIQNTLRLLNLPDDVKKTMVKEKLSEGVMRPLVSRDEATIKKVLPKIIDEGWTARKVERYFAENKKKSSSAAIKRSGYIKDENALAAKYNTPVKITGHSLTFKCKTDSDLKSLINLLKLTCFILLGATLASLATLQASSTFADDTAISDISLSVPVSCNVNSTLDVAHDAEISAGTYRQGIGTTTFQVVCNDNSGFSIYAIGYSNEEFGNTKLLATINNELNPTYDIATGTATSGSTSNWAMKLTPVAGTYAPTITNGYSAYSNVPTNYTKVATFASTTDFTIGSKLQTTYAVFVDNTKPAGTYNGKVRYTLVHPANETPLQPQDCASNKICYWPNASGVVDSMGDQSKNYDTNTSNIASNMSVNIWPSNFKRDGYGFAGWSDKFDWVLNANDANGNGTGANAGYHIYGPMQSITTPSDMTTKGLSLYAVWVKSSGNLQGWTCPNNTTMPVGTVTALKDTRDNNVYAVAKLVDGNCWMVENLRLADKTANNTAIELSATNTNNPSLPLTNAWWFNTDNDSDTKPTSNSLSTPVSPSSTTPWCNATKANCQNQSMLSTDNTTNPATNMTAPDASTAVYSYGNYYNWYSATAGNGTSSVSQINTSVSGDLCPTGWRLPKGGNKTRIESDGDNEFWNLTVVGLNNNAKPANNYYYTGLTETGPVVNALKSYPNNFLYSGEVSSSLVGNRGIMGYYWSSTAYHSNYAYTLRLNSTFVYPGTYEYYKYYGRSVRCLTKS